MSEELIHFWNELSGLTPCGVNILVTPYSRYSDRWNEEVTCGACKLERPFEPAPEYKIPANVTAADKFVGAETLLADILPAAAAAHRRLAEAQDFVRIAETTLAGAQRLLEQAKAAVGDITPGGQVPTPQDRSEGVADSFEVDGAEGSVIAEKVGERWRVRPKAPVSAVDIRTEVHYSEGMTDKLSKDAQTALINASAKKGMVAIVGKTTNQELRDAGLLGPNRGLTRAGEVARQRLMQDREDQAFG